MTLRTRTRTSTRVLAGTALVGALLGAAAPAFAALAAPEATAYVVSADAFSGLAAVPPQPQSTYPSGGTQQLAGIHAGAFSTDSVLTATTAGDPAAGTSSADAAVDRIAVNLGLGTADLTGVHATCTATPGGATGNGTISAGTVTVAGVPTSLQAGAAPNTSVTLPNLGTAVLNEQSTDADGVLTVNAVHFVLLPALNGANLVIGHARCGGAQPAQAVPVAAPGVAAGGLALAGLLGTVHLRRRGAAAREAGARMLGED